MRLPGRDLRHQLPCRKSRAEPRSCPIPGPGVHRPGHRRSGRARSATACDDLGLRRAGQFTWGATAAATLDVYREAAGHRRKRRK